MASQAAPPAASRAPGTIGHVVELQKDGLLLLRHLAETRQLYTVQGQAAGADPGATPELLIADPVGIAADATRFGALLDAVHELARAAAPATAASIRITAGYVHGLNHPTGYGAGDPPEAEPGARAAQALLAKGRGLRKKFWALMVGTILGALATLLALVHLENGRRILEQHRESGAALRSSSIELARLAPVDQHFLRSVWQDGRFVADATEDHANPPELCWPRVEPPKDGERHLLPRSERARELCEALYRQQMRESLVFARLETWNCTNYRLSQVVPLEWLAAGRVTIWKAFSAEPASRACPDLHVSLGPPATAKDWQRTEFYTADGIAHLGGYVLPLLLCALGSAVHALRMAEARVATFTLSAHDWLASMLRIVLAAIIGGLLALIFDPAKDVQVGSYALSLAAFAFLIGYALDRVLRALDGLVDGTLAGLQARRGAAQPAPAGGAPQPQRAASAPKPAPEVTAAAPRTGG